MYYSTIAVTNAEQTKQHECEIEKLESTVTGLNKALIDVSILHL
jgi:hypothetical protein